MNSGDCKETPLVGPFEFDALEIVFSEMCFLEFNCFEIDSYKPGCFETSSFEIYSFKTGTLEFLDFTISGATPINYPGL